MKTGDAEKLKSFIQSVLSLTDDELSEIEYTTVYIKGYELIIAIDRIMGDFQAEYYVHVLPDTMQFFIMTQSENFNSLIPTTLLTDIPDKGIGIINEIVHH